ncbi:MAG: hypothetical protein ACJ72D_06260 [Marmoricola sp.]
MTDHDDPTPDPTPGDADGTGFEDITALLAGARVTDPIPTDVAARLDATLADLTAGRVGTDSSPTLAAPLADVVPLERARTRSRLAPRLLVAAVALAAVGAGGVGIAQVVKHSDGSGSSASADSAAKSSTPGAADSGTASAGGTGGGVPAPASGDFDSAFSGLPQLTTADFSGDVARLTGDTRAPVYGLPVDPQATTAPEPQAVSPEGAPTGPGDPLGDAATADLPRTTTNQLKAARQACAGPDVAGADVQPVLLDGQPAALVVHPESGGTQLVEAWSCDGSQVLATTSLKR